MHLKRIDNIIIVKPDKRSAFNASLESLMEDLLSVVNTNKKRDFILDFGNIDYIESLDIRYLFEINKKIKEYGRHLIICNLNEAIKQIVSIVNLGKIISIYQDKEHAIEYLQKLK